MTKLNKGLSFFTILFFTVLFYYANTLPTSHKKVEEGQIIHTNVFGGVVEVTDSLPSPDYSSEEAWEDSLKKEGYYNYEEQ